VSGCYLGGSADHRRTRGEESVDTKINELTEQLEEIREEVKDGRPQPNASPTN